MVHNLYLVLVVFFRTGALWLAVRTVLGFVYSAVISQSFSNSGLAWTSLFLTLLAAVALWLLSKPLANTITKDLG